MNSFLYPASVSWGSAHSGQAAFVRYQVTAANGNLKVARTNSGVTELDPGSGLYGADIPLATDWGFVRILWDLEGTDLAAVHTLDTGLGVASPTEPTSLVATFDAGLATLRDRVRLRVGDVDGTPQWFLADASIDALLRAYEGQLGEVCALCSETIGAICNQRASEVQQRNMRRVYEDRAKNAFALADRIRNLAAVPPEGPPNNGALGGRLESPGLDRYAREMRRLEQESR